MYGLGFGSNMKLLWVRIYFTCYYYNMIKLFLVFLVAYVVLRIA